MCLSIHTCNYKELTDINSSLIIIIITWSTVLWQKWDVDTVWCELQNSRVLVDLIIESLDCQNKWLSIGIEPFGLLYMYSVGVVVYRTWMLWKQFIVYVGLLYSMGSYAPDFLVCSAYLHEFVTCGIHANLTGLVYSLHPTLQHTHTHQTTPPTTHTPPTGLQHPVPSFSTIYTWSQRARDEVSGHVNFSSVLAPSIYRKMSCTSSCSCNTTVDQTC